MATFLCRCPICILLVFVIFKQRLNKNKIIQPKWFRTEYDLKEGDVVLFSKQDSLLSKTYQYGMVVSVQQSSDGVIRKVKVKYRNENENGDRDSFRSVRQLVMIHPVNEIYIIEEINNLWRRGVVVITTAQLHSTKPELKFCAGSNSARGVSEIRDGEDL